MHSLAYKSDGTLWAWTTSRELAMAAPSFRAAPVPVIAGVDALAAGNFHVLAIKTDRTLWVWGYNGTAAKWATVRRPTTARRRRRFSLE